MAFLMVVDDDEDFANAVATALRNAGHEVDVQLTVAGALERMQSRPPDLAILDVMFPEDISAGFDLARRMRRDLDDLKGVPILMLTSVNQVFPFGFGPSDIGTESLPVDDFVEKPIDFDTLLTKVSALLEKTRATGQRGEA